MNWKSTYKLPLSFIIFFVLVFFLLGEQLPALPIYLFGPGVGNSGDKVSILDLNPGDALHRPLAYILFGTFNWILFRFFTWPLVWTIGGTLWTIDQLFLTPPDHRPSISGLPSLIFYILTSFTLWGVLTLVPYFIYRAVDRKWGGKGKRNAILLVLVINLLLLGFFYFQIYVLHNSYHASQNDQRNNCQPGNPNNGPDCPK